LPRLPPGGSVSFDEFEKIVHGIEMERKQRREIQELLDKTKSVCVGLNWSIDVDISAALANWLNSL
jgi:hypothetical protein